MKDQWRMSGREGKTEIDNLNESVWVCVCLSEWERKREEREKESKREERENESPKMFQMATNDCWIVSADRVLEWKAKANTNSGLKMTENWTKMFFKS